MLEVVRRLYPLAPMIKKEEDIGYILRLVRVGCGLPPGARLEAARSQPQTARKTPGWRGRLQASSAPGGRQQFRDRQEGRIDAGTAQKEKQQEDGVGLRLQFETDDRCIGRVKLGRNGADHQRNQKEQPKQRPAQLLEHLVDPEEK